MSGVTTVLKWLVIALVIGTIIGTPLYFIQNWSWDLGLIVLSAGIMLYFAKMLLKNLLRWLINRPAFQRVATAYPDLVMKLITSEEKTSDPKEVARESELQKTVSAVRKALQLGVDTSQGTIVRTIATLRESAASEQELKDLFALLQDVHAQLPCAPLNLKKGAKPTAHNYLVAIRQGFSERNTALELSRKELERLKTDPNSSEQLQHRVTAQARQIEQLTEDLKSTTDSRNSHEQNGTALRGQLAAAEKLAEDRARSIRQLNEKLENAGREKGRQILEVTTLKQALDAAKETGGSAANRVTELVRLLSAAEDRSKELDRQLQQLKLELDAANGSTLEWKELAASSETRARELEAANADYVSANTQLLESNQALTESNTAYVEANAEWQAAHEQLTALNEEFRIANEGLVAQNGEFATTNEQLTQRLSEIETRPAAPAVALSGGNTGKVRNLGRGVPRTPAPAIDLRVLNDAIATKLALIETRENLLFQLLFGVIVEVYRRAKDPDDTIHNMKYRGLSEDILHWIFEKMREDPKTKEFESTYGPMMKPLTAFEDFDFSDRRLGHQQWMLEGIITLAYEAGVNVGQEVPAFNNPICDQTIYESAERIIESYLQAA